MWYNILLDLDDLDDDLAILALLSTSSTSTTFVLTTLRLKEYSTSAKIKAIYMLKDKKSLGQIREAIGVLKSAIYRLVAITRERRWVENKNIPLEVSYILNILRSSRPIISAQVIKCILKVIL
jgi:hypothetical protein